MKRLAHAFAYSWLGFLVFLFVAIAYSYCTGRATAADLTPDQARSIYYVAYGQFHGPREWLEQAPTIFLTSRDRLCTLYGTQPGCLVEGLYLEDTVYLDETLDFGTLHAASVLLHEYVHHFQRLHHGPPLDCEDSRDRERQAYAIQANVVEKAGDDRLAAGLRRTAASLSCR